MRQLTISLIFIFSIFSGFAQKSSTIKKLQSELNRASEERKAEIYCELSNLFLSKDVQQSIDYADKAVELAQKTKSEDCEAKALMALGASQAANLMYKEAKDNYDRAHDLLLKTKDEENRAICLFGMGIINNEIDRNRKATKFFEESMELAQKNGMQDLILQNNEALFNIYYERNRFRKALEYFKEYMKIKDSTFVVAKKQELSVLYEKYAVEQIEKEKAKKELIVKDSTLHVVDSTLSQVSKERDTLAVRTEQQGATIEALNYEKAYHEKLIQNQKLQRNLLFVLVAIVIIGILAVYNRYIYRKKTGEKLQLQNAQILQQKEEIESQRDNLQEVYEELEKHNENITSSIRYAQRIQQAALPNPDDIIKLLPNSFILYKPRDIVSGDFYWIKEINNKIIVVAADCTGHGVPGAFVSMLGISLLNEITQKLPKLRAGKILEEMRIQIKKSLRQTGKSMEQKDGMDLALTIFDFEEMKIQYAGANNPLVYIRDDKVTTIKATKNPIGIYLVEKEFTNHEFEIKKGDLFYMYSDGYVDQFGGERGYKFKSNKFKELLLENHKLPLTEQKELLDQTFEDWRGKEYEQIDDVLVMAVKV